jgi:hypothetical protein
MKETLIHLALGILGVIAHSLLKYNDLKSKATAGNIVFTFKQYLTEDWVTVSLSFVCVGLWMFLFDDAAKAYPKIADYTRLSFALMGFAGSYIIQYIGSAAQKKITAIIDAKTTALDGTQKPGTDINTKTVTTLPNDENNK